MLVSARSSYRFVAVIIIMYLVLGCLYAVKTPKWQVPDEPAHFNYIRYIALYDALPVLQEGDYPHKYLEEIKAAGFPSSMSIDSIRYESWQPPLYYALAAAFYRLTSSLGADRQFLSLRLISVLLGAAVLAVIFEIARQVFPERPFIPLAAVGFAATIPMHVAMTAGIGNDTLAELVLGLILLQAMSITKSGIDGQRTVVTGMLLGLALLTKSTIYASVLVVAAALWSSRLRCTRGPSQGITPIWAPLLGILALALLFGGPWFLRNMQVYGLWDPLAWQRHGLVVTEQPRSADLLSSVGAFTLLRQFILTTFRSFWGQFGWMGVLLDRHIYQALGLWSAMLVAGLVLLIARTRLKGAPARRLGQSFEQTQRRRALCVLAASALLTVLLYLGYNIEFVQHQGRYLFPALAPMSIAVGLGLSELFRQRNARAVAVALLLLLLGDTALGVLRGDPAGWTLVLLAGVTAVFACAGWLPERWRGLAPAGLYLAFLALDWISLYWYVVPALQPVGGS